MKKILYITNSVYGAGGLERVISIKTNLLIEKYGYEIHILTLNSKNKPLFYEFNNKIQFHDFSINGNILNYLWRYVKNIRTLYKTIHPDIISVCDDALKGFFVPLILRVKTPIIYERHASKAFNTTATITNRVEGFLMENLARHFSKFVVLTNRNKQEWNLKNACVIPNPLSFYSESSSTLQNKVIVAVGSHSYNKGYDLLLKAWKLINNSEFSDWQLDIYGKPDNNQTFIKLAQDLDLKSINFSTPVTEIQAVYLSASMLVLPSRSEGFGMVLIEAMSCGVPCIAFDCPSGPSDILTDGVDGILVEEQNIQKLAESMIELMQHYNVRKNMGENAKINSKKYLAHTIVKQWDELFKNL